MGMMLRRHRQRLLTAALLAGAAHGVPITPSPPPAPVRLPNDKELPKNFTARGILASAGIETYQQLVKFSNTDLAQLTGLDQEKLQKVREARDKWAKENPEPAPQQEPPVGQQPEPEAPKE